VSPSEGVAVTAANGPEDAASDNRRTAEASHFDERSFFSAVHASGVRALLIGRRALVLLGLPLLTADYDYWIAIDDIERFNALAATFQLHPTRTAADARRHGRYVLENDEHVDVLVAIRADAARVARRFRGPVDPPSDHRRRDDTRLHPVVG
jgi:hypothetical protein